MLALSAQTGKSETLLDIIGQRLDERPVPILYVGPNRQFLLEQFEPRIMALLDEAPLLRRKVARGKRMTKTRKVISGVPLRLAHAGSSTALKSDPAGLAIIDETDELMANVKGQGDPVGLVDARGDTYPDFCVAMVSTPSKGMKETDLDPDTGLQFWKSQDAEDLDSVIWTYWQSGTRYHWAWLCPHCKERFIPRFSCLEYIGKGDEKSVTGSQARETAVLICPRNGCVIRNEHKVEMNESGAFFAPGMSIGPDGEPIGHPEPNETASFWVSGLCSPFQSFGDRAALYVEAVNTGDAGKVQTVINAGFGELWAPSGGDAPAWAEVSGLRLPYRFRDVPEGVLFLTAGVDVQKRKLVYVVRGWGVRQESWLIEHGELHGSGDTRLDDVWVDLWGQVLDAEYGGGMRIARAFVDSGFRPDDPKLGDINKVYDFCRRHRRICYATKGWDRRPQPISVAKIEVTPSGKKPKFGLDLVHLDSDYVKEWVHSRIRWPSEQPGGWHISADATEDYCRQMVNESRTRKPGGGHVWVPRGPHDYLDAEAMAYAAAKMLGLDRIADNVTRRAPAAPKPPADDVKNVPETLPPPPPAAAPRNSWLGNRTSDWLRR